MSKGHHKDYPCPVCTSKLILEACGCMTCEACGHVVRPSGVYEGKVLAEGHIRHDAIHEAETWTGSFLVFLGNNQVKQVPVIILEKRVADA